MIANAQSKLKVAKHASLRDLPGLLDDSAW